MELLDQANHTLQDLDKTTHDLIRASGERKRKRSGGIISAPITANDPQYLVTIDREKARTCMFL